MTFETGDKTSARIICTKVVYKTQKFSISLKKWLMSILSIIIYIAFFNTADGHVPTDNFIGPSPDGGFG